MPEISPAKHSPLATLLVTTAVLGVGFVAWLGAYPALREGWYLGQARPSWAPPTWLFGPAGTLLFVLQGIAAAWVREADASRARRLGLAFFVAQLALYATWSWAFFTWRNAAAASLVALALVALVAATLWSFGRVRSGTAWLLLPYFLWVCYLAALTITMRRLNPAVPPGASSACETCVLLR